MAHSLGREHRRADGPGNTADGYRFAVYKHLNPGVGAHWIDRLEPAHLEKLYARMMESGKAAGTAHQAHRTVRTALNEQ